MSVSTRWSFECPECDGIEYNGHDDGVRECDNCRFSWPAEHDWKYMVYAVEHRARSAEEYAAVRTMKVDDRSAAHLEALLQRILSAVCVTGDNVKELRLTYSQHGWAVSFYTADSQAPHVVRGGESLFELIEYIATDPRTFPSLNPTTTLAFQCPRCNGQQWSVGRDGRSRCINAECGFSWKEADAWRYFVHTTMRPFKSREEFESMQREKPVFPVPRSRP